ncbi:MAG: glycosyltransferase family 39 protein [Anaerolineales bacterium]
MNPSPGQLAGDSGQLAGANRQVPPDSGQSQIPAGPGLAGASGPEPTVLDWLKSVLRGRPLPIESEETPDWVPPAEPAAPRREPWRWTRAHIRLPVALFLAFFAQFGLEQRSGPIGLFIAFYLIAAVLVGWAVWAGDFPKPATAEPGTPSDWIRRRGLLGVGIVLALLTFLTSGGNEFRGITLVVWFGSLVILLAAFWDGDLSWSAWRERVRRWVGSARSGWRIQPWTIVVLAGLALCAFFRFSLLTQVPREMVSDHAEKLLDVVDVLNGQHSIFFPRNTGREAFQFYLAAATTLLLGTGVSFLTLKIGTALAGWVTLPFIYGLGKDMGGRWAGLAAMLLAGVGYWPNIIGRSGLRFPLYSLFAAPALYFLIRGLRNSKRNDLLLSGLFLGIGLHGYTPFRIMPLAVGLGLLLALLHTPEARTRRALWMGFLAAAVIAIAATMPLIRVSLDFPENVFLRTLSRIGTTEVPLPGPAVSIFFSNVWNALRMYAWDDGDIWVVSIPHRPALDWITGALFHMGAAAALIRYVRRKSWPDLYLLLLIPVLMLPSIASLAFPAENPAPNRASGAMIPVFVLAGIFLADAVGWMKERLGTERGERAGLAAVGALFAFAAILNYQLVFGHWAPLHRKSSWNTSMAGNIVRSFADSIGTLETSHVMGFAHWMDTRLVGIVAGDPTRDYAIFPDQLETLLGEARPQLFVVNPQDTVALERLTQVFPQGYVQPWFSGEEGHDFLLYWVPPSGSLLLPPPP